MDVSEAERIWQEYNRLSWNAQGTLIRICSRVYNFETDYDPVVIDELLENKFIYSNLNKYAYNSCRVLSPTGKSITIWLHSIDIDTLSNKKLCAILSRGMDLAPSMSDFGDGLDIGFIGQKLHGDSQHGFNIRERKLTKKEKLVLHTIYNAIESVSLNVCSTRMLDRLCEDGWLEIHDGTVSITIRSIMLIIFGTERNQMIQVFCDENIEEHMSEEMRNTAIATVTRQAHMWDAKHALQELL
jgi:hypothetical protein